MLAQLVSTHIASALQLASLVHAVSAVLHEFVFAHEVQPAQSVGLQVAPELLAPELLALEALDELELDALELEEVVFPPPPLELEPPLPQLAAVPSRVTSAAHVTCHRNILSIYPSSSALHERPRRHAGDMPLPATHAGRESRAHILRVRANRVCPHLQELSHATFGCSSV
jgi:hypothetical protein